MRVASSSIVYSLTDHAKPGSPEIKPAPRYSGNRNSWNFHFFLPVASLLQSHGESEINGLLHWQLPLLALLPSSKKKKKKKLYVMRMRLPFFRRNHGWRQSAKRKLFNRRCTSTCFFPVDVNNDNCFCVHSLKEKMHLPPTFSSCQKETSQDPIARIDAQWIKMLVHLEMRDDSLSWGCSQRQKRKKRLKRIHKTVHLSRRMRSSTWLVQLRTHCCTSTLHSAKSNDSCIADNLYRSFAFKVNHPQTISQRRVSSKEVTNNLLKGVDCSWISMYSIFFLPLIYLIFFCFVFGFFKSFYLFWKESRRRCHLKCTGLV